MATKKAAKEFKRLKRKTKEVASANLALEKRVQKLKKKLGTRNRQIANLERRLDQTFSTPEASKLPTAQLGDHDENNIASSQRAAWKRYSFLRESYESHLGDGATKARARQLANEDLKREYGTDCGYTDEELATILS